ncbi:pyrroline-5-carboxylate synthetase-like protein [Reticulomyxa filosa]|uniref:glutamate-5-semialdehyde dehydrogenase n=1 Tax=Reticulomyxa filosa TaxID=46433 RepID=X6N933_RETFI|nr:pyrroline-5-carboxylate synthetase-like protein [Reticulomyxa filosa]|eukprot:ETO22561.1 pyrroline-5-carboxylate synthetase-like protein [Reticulomyxa filosa]
MTSDIRARASQTREASQKLIKLSSEERANILETMAKSLIANQKQIVTENAKDMALAQKQNIVPSLIKRLALTPKKLQELANGIRAIAKDKEPIGKILRRTQIAEDLIVRQETVPFGVLLVIFESRPDCLPQVPCLFLVAIFHHEKQRPLCFVCIEKKIASLAVRSGNGLLLKGGSEAYHSNHILHQLLSDAIFEASEGRVPKSLLGLIENREEISQVLKLEDAIDLIIPRGSSSLVKYIQNNTKIPVLGHAEGICHLFVDECVGNTVTIDDVIDIVLDAKLNYPAACNAVETLLLHENLFCQHNNSSNKHGQSENNFTVAPAMKIIATLRMVFVFLKTTEGFFFWKLQYKGVKLFGDESIRRIVISPEIPPLLHGYHHEYSDESLSVVVVRSLQEAILHINRYGSGHTETIVTENLDHAREFAQQVDSACVFHNASTRFADGFRLGLGAEVGISTGKLHCRGPMGVDGLLTTRWIMSSQRAQGHCVGDFDEQNANTKRAATYIHKDLMSVLSRND